MPTSYLPPYRAPTEHLPPCTPTQLPTHQPSATVCSLPLPTATYCYLLPPAATCCHLLPLLLPTATYCSQGGDGDESSSLLESLKRIVRKRGLSGLFVGLQASTRRSKSTRTLPAPVPMPVPVHVHVPMNMPTSSGAACACHRHHLGAAHHVRLDQAGARPARHRALRPRVIPLPQGIAQSPCISRAWPHMPSAGLHPLCTPTPPPPEASGAAPFYRV